MTGSEEQTSEEPAGPAPQAGGEGEAPDVTGSGAADGAAAEREGAGPAAEPEPTPPPDPVRAAAEAYERYEAAFEDVAAPFAFVDLDAVWANAADMLRRAAGKPIRIASKSVRSRPVLERLLDLDRGFQGILGFTLPEALWLWEQGMRDIVVAYPTADRASLARLARLTSSEPEPAPVLMVDSLEQLELIENAAGAFTAPLRVAMDVDLSYRLLGGLVKIGPKRSPVRTPEAAAELAREIREHPRFSLAGLMAYEGQIAGVGDAVPGRPLRSLAIRAMQRGSARDIRARRAEIVEAVMDVTELEFVNGGGTGSIEMTASEGAVTEIAAGSGFYAPVLFDHYTAFSLTPAAMFALPVVRRPGRGMVTALGGGYPASGAGGRDRMPVPHLPAGLKLDAFEGAGEVQTPLRGRAADALEIGDRVYMRHVKAGELCERFDRLYLVAGGSIRDEVATYRGEGKAFL